MSNLVALVTPHNFEDTGRGQRCQRDVNRGEVLLSVPLSSCWTVANAKAHPELAGLEACPDQDLLALHLLLERAKGEASARHSHIASLPTSFDTPTFWTEAELAELTGSTWQDTSAEFKSEMLEDWQRLPERMADKAALLLQNGAP